MDSKLFEQLHAEGLISGESFAKIKLAERTKLLSVHWEIRTFLYLGVLLLSAGLGTLIYKHIDTIGHQAILVFIALVCAACFYYCVKSKLPFSTGKVTAPTPFFDYVLLLGCSTFIIFIAYLQFEYNFFGNRYGLASFFPMAVLFFCAYYFDHLGILSMAIVNLALWLGITVTPLQILKVNDFSNTVIIFTGLALGILLMLVAWVTEQKKIKRHFEFTYANFGTHIAMISCLAAIFHFESFYLGWFLLLIGMLYFLYQKALAGRSFYFILIMTLYGYIGMGYVVVQLLGRISDGIAAVYLGLFYFIFSAIGIVLFLIRTNKKIKTA